MWGIMTLESFLGTGLTFIISLLLTLRYKKMKLVLIIPISAIAGSLFSEIIEWNLEGILYGRLITNGLVSLCTIGLTKMFIKIFLTLRPKLLKLSNFLERNSLDYEELTDKEIKQLNELDSENVFGLPILILGIIGFLFGPQFLFIPIATLLLGVILLGSLDRSKGQNPWTFYMGIMFSIIGIFLHQADYVHILNL
ncbi:hypothetical protein [Lentibacillus salicampi]|uniref:Uncharacterized protein n=1 Tax=Lentibacillus salicampi TaxID=175306 RepID=A0A4Y9ACV0_9BACI|nr:hypothetical protein [Lentibacillus salicampi]TFJ93142.1 hypothetical protein E4U82_08725 [Lentibacillus salicampi]